MFKSKEVGPNNEVIVPAPMDHLDPVKEHRFFCPWKNAHTQRLGSARPNADNDLPAWEMLTQSLRNEAYLRGVLDESTKGRSKAIGVASQHMPATPRTPRTPATAGQETTYTPGGAEEEDDEAARDAKDKERWARLRRVKSLFDTKGSRRLRRAGTTSRPGTAVSTKSTKTTTSTENQ